MGSLRQEGLAVARFVARVYLIHYWSGMSNVHHIEGIAIIISTRLQPSVVEVTLVDECLMRLSLKHCLGFMSIVAGYVRTETCETEEGIAGP